MENIWYEHRVVYNKLKYEIGTICKMKMQTVVGALEPVIKNT